MTQKNPVSLGSLIRTIRLRKGLTMQEVADRMHIRETTLRKYELNELIPRTSTRKALAEALGVAPFVLLSDWTPEVSSAIGHLISYFELFGGSFIEKDGHTAIEFSSLAPFVEAWAKTHDRISSPHASAAQKDNQDAALESYFDYLVSGISAEDLAAVPNPAAEIPSLCREVQLTMEAPPNLRHRKKETGSF